MGLFEMLRRRDQAEATAAAAGPHLPSAPRADVEDAAPSTIPAEPRLNTARSSSSRSPAARLERSLARAPATTRPALDPGLEPRPAGEVLAHFHQLPPYQALLTVGSEAVYQLPPVLHEKLVAIDCGARQARLVRASMPVAEVMALDGSAKAVKGALRARGYRIVDELVAQPQVLREILRNAGASGKGGAKGGPMQLFERWIALAVPTGATDLHIEVRRNVALLRIRVDGRMEPLPDGQGGRYSRKEAVDAIAAGYNSTRLEYDPFQVVPNGTNRLAKSEAIQGLAMPELCQRVPSCPCLTRLF